MSCRVVFGVRFWFLLCFLSGCFSTPQNPHYLGPKELSKEQISYYSSQQNYQSFKVTGQEKFPNFIKETLEIKVNKKTLIVDYFHSSKKTKELIFVFPILGGKPLIENHFARYFARHGLDAAIIRRVDDFKKADRFYHLEEIFRENVKHDRLVLDFFEKEFAKTKFGAFGLSRGAINVAMTAAVDKRLKYNILCLGGTDLVSLFQKSSQKGIKKYLKRVEVATKLSQPEIFTYLRNNIKTDPKNLAGAIDARNTLLILALFDSAVPTKYGLRLREQIGNPETIYLLSGHATGLLFTEFTDIVLPRSPLGSLSFDYLETESLDFYQKNFGLKRRYWKQIPLRILRAPLDLLGGVVSLFF